MNRLTVFGETVTDGGSGSWGSWGHTNWYDRWGNRWATGTLPQGMVTPSWAGAIDGGTNRVVTGFNNAAIGYTASGEMKSHPQYGQMVWDVEGRMRGAGGGVYGYDGDGVRVKKTVGGVTTYYVGDGMGNVGAEYGGAGAETGTRYLVGDHLGSVRVVVDGAGVVKARCDYAPFGEKIDGTGAFGNRDLIGEYACGDAGAGGRFTGKERDGETGLDLFSGPEVDPITKGESVMLRYYSGAQGRFTSPDKPLLDQWVGDPQSWNLFSYVRNNPLSFFDLSGGKCKKTKDGFEGDCVSPGDEKVRSGGIFMVTRATVRCSTLTQMVVKSSSAEPPVGKSGLMCLAKPHRAFVWS